MEGENSQVEMKLSTDEEEVGGNGVGEHLNHNSTRKSYISQKLRRTPKNLCFLAATCLLIFIIGECGSLLGADGLSWNLTPPLFLSFTLSGYLIGYLVQTKKDVAPSCSTEALTFEDSFSREDNVIPLMDWEDVKKILNEKVSAAKFEPVFT